MTRACCSPSRSRISKAIYDRDIAYRAATVGVASRPAIRYIRDVFTANVIALVSQRVLFYHVPVTLLSRECLYSDIWSWILSLLLLFTLATTYLHLWSGVEQQNKENTELCTQDYKRYKLNPNIQTCTKRSGELKSMQMFYNSVMSEFLSLHFHIIIFIFFFQYHLLSSCTCMS